jgi:hypothetical protein
MLGKHYVYLLVNTDHQIFKVGETEGIHTRVKELCKHLNYDIKNSYVFTFSSYTEAIELEKLVHKNFKNFNVPKKDLPKFAGYTELYYDVILQDIILFISKSSFSCEFELLKNYYRRGHVPFKDIIE